MGGQKATFRDPPKIGQKRPKNGQNPDPRPGPQKRPFFENNSKIYLTSIINNKYVIKHKKGSKIGPEKRAQKKL
jgi:hypothetical protein